MRDGDTRLSGDLERLQALAEAGPLTLGALIDALNARGHAFVCLILAFPFLTPIPLPGVSIPFGVMIIVAAVSMAIGVPPWVPARLRKKELPREQVAKALGFSLRILRKVEFLVKPRGEMFLRFPGLVRMAGIAMAICGFLLALPLPPGTNFPPALGVVLVAIGVLEGDSIVLGLGLIVAMINAAVFGAVSVFGFDYIRGLWHK